MAGTKIVVRWAKLVLDWYYVTACASIVSNLFSSKMYRFDSDSIMLPQHHLSDGFGVNINGWCPFGWKVSVLNSNFQSKFFSVPKKESRLWISKEKGQQSASKPFLACHRCVATANLALWLNHIQLFSSDQKNGAHFSVSFFLCHWFGNLISEFINVSQQLKLYTPFRWCRRCFRLFPSSIWIFSLVRFRSPQKKYIRPYLHMEFRSVALSTRLRLHFFHVFLSIFFSIIWYLTLNICVNASKQHHLHVWSIPEIWFASAILVFLNLGKWKMESNVLISFKLVLEQKWRENTSPHKKVNIEPTERWERV